jgi:hypothetical protein
MRSFPSAKVPGDEGRGISEVVDIEKAHTRVEGSERAAFSGRCRARQG